MPQFKTIRQTAALGVLPEYRIRLMVEAGECPGIWSGNRFMVNVDLLIEMLDKMSRDPGAGRKEETVNA